MMEEGEDAVDRPRDVLGDSNATGELLNRGEGVVRPTTTVSRSRALCLSVLKTGLSPDGSMLPWWHYADDAALAVERASERLPPSSTSSRRLACL